MSSEDIKPGYKRTEVGVIPEDWKVKAFGDCLLGKPRYGINAPAVPFSDRLPAYIRITDITEDGRFGAEKPVSVDSSFAGNYYLNDGDIVFARTGASVGKSYRYVPDDGPLVFAGFLIQVRPNPEVLSSAYAATYVTTGAYWNWVRLMSMRSGQPGINGNEFAKLPVPIPSVAEQRAIATALSDVDTLLAKLDQLIAKKRDLKQATMQQLLTGQTRLPGFSGAWEVKRLGDMLTYLGNGAVYEPTNSFGLPVTRIETIANGVIDFSRVGYAIPTDEIKNYKLKKGDVLFSHINSIDHIGKVAIYESDATLYHGMNLLLLRPAEAVISRYLFYWLSSTHGRKKSATMAKQAVSQASINTVELRGIEIPLPSVAEQTAIATVLSDIDTELAALEARRNKTRALKQGMMQELLTGRIRLV